MTGPKERAYDDELSPLVREVLRICREHKINMAIYFALDAVADNSIIQCRSVCMNDLEDTVGATTLVGIHRAITQHVDDDEGGAPAQEGVN